MSVSEVLLCPYRYLKDIMVKLELKIQLCFYSPFLIILLPSVYPVYFLMSLQKEQYQRIIADFHSMYSYVS